MELFISISTDNDAFQENLVDELRYVLSQILQETIVEGGLPDLHRLTLRDSNGNNVGEVRYENR